MVNHCITIIALTYLFLGLFPVHDEHREQLGRISIQFTWSLKAVVHLSRTAVMFYFQQKCVGSVIGVTPLARYIYIMHHHCSSFPINHNLDWHQFGYWASLSWSNCISEHWDKKMSDYLSVRFYTSSSYEPHNTAQTSWATPSFLYSLLGKWDIGATTFETFLNSCGNTAFKARRDNIFIRKLKTNIWYDHLCSSTQCDKHVCNRLLL